MKILVLQLARLGDILLARPTLRALRRKYPQAQIDFMVRSSFSAAAADIESVSNTLYFSVQEFLPSLMSEPMDVTAALSNWNQLIENLRYANYDQIINLSFSPLSSYIVAEVANNDTQVRGYTRHSDGYLNILDDPSAYFYAQVGIAKANRFHLTEIFAAVADVETCPEDFIEPESIGNLHQESMASIQPPYVVVHIGASQQRRTFGVFKWQQILRQIERQWSGTCVLIGNEEEIDAAQRILNGAGLTRTVSMVGKLSFRSLFPVIRKSNLFIGADSGPLHIASLVGTKAVNFSFAFSNFWETGPRTPSSRVVWTEDPDSLPSDRLVEEILEVLAGVETSTGRYIVRRQTTFEMYGYPTQDFNWKMIEAIYTGKPFPVVESEIVFVGIKRLAEVVDLAISQLQNLNDDYKRSIAVEILTQVDEIFVQLERVVVELQPLIGWFQTERLRIGPQSFEHVFTVTLNLFLKLREILRLYVGSAKEWNANGASSMDIG